MRIYPVNEFYQKRLGARIVKLPVGFSDNCPNRMGIRGMKTCSFCDPWGSAADERLIELPVEDQIRIQMERKMERFGEGAKYLVYFQAYTTTFTKLAGLREEIVNSLKIPKVVGFVIGTRPDCLSPSFGDMLREFSFHTFVSVELGVQSFNNSHLEFLRRGHSSEDSVRAIQWLKSLPNVHVGAHLIFGLPGETELDVIDSAEKLSRLQVNDVKLHHLHVLKKTHLADLYVGGQFEPIDLDTYTSRVVLFLRHLDSEIAIHRLSGLSGRWDEVLAPEWTRHKLRVYQTILDAMERQDARQGDLRIKSQNIEQFSSFISSPT